MTPDLDPQTDDRLSAYLDGELSGDERVDFEALLDSREDYQDALAQLQAMRERFSALATHQAPPTVGQVIVDRIADADSVAITPSKHAEASGHSQKTGRSVRFVSVVAAVGALAACLALTTVFDKPKSIDVAQATDSSKREKEESFGGESSPVRESRTDSELTAAEGTAANPSPSRRSDASLKPDDRTTAADSTANETSDERERARGGSRNELRQRTESELADMEADVADVVTPSDDPILAESAVDPAVRLQSRSASHVPEIYIEVQSDAAYDQLLTVISNARFELEPQPEPSGQQNYERIQSQLANRQQAGGRASEPMVTQVIDVTSTAEGMAQLIEVARNQGANVSNSPEAGAWIAQQSSQRKASKQSGFSGAINNWQQIAIADETAGNSEESENLGRDMFMNDSRGTVSAMPNLAMPRANAVEQDSYGPSFRWRITIQPAPQTESGPAAP